jgi:hypothetical protein
VLVSPGRGVPVSVADTVADMVCVALGLGVALRVGLPDSVAVGL